MSRINMNKTTPCKWLDSQSRENLANFIAHRWLDFAKQCLEDGRSPAGLSAEDVWENYYWRNISEEMEEAGKYEGRKVRAMMKEHSIAHAKHWIRSCAEFGEDEYAIVREHFTKRTVAC